MLIECMVLRYHLVATNPFALAEEPAPNWCTKVSERMMTLIYIELDELWNTRILVFSAMLPDGVAVLTCTYKSSVRLLRIR